MGFLKIKLGIFRRPFGSNDVGVITALSQMLFYKHASLIYQLEWFYGVSKKIALDVVMRLLWLFWEGCGEGGVRF